MTDKRPSAADPQPINAQIIIRPVARTRKDVGDWRNIHRAAEWSPDQLRVQLYDLYDDVLLDGVLADQVDKLHFSVTTGKLLFINNDGKEIPEVTRLFETEAWNTLLCELVNTRLWGYTVLEIDFDPNNFKVFNIPRKHIRPLKGLIAIEQSITGGNDIEYRQPPYLNYIIESGEPRDLGKLLKVAPYVLYKRGALADWAQFSEIFGMPVRKATYDGFNEKAREEAQRALDEAGAALSIVLPKEVGLEIIGNTSGNIDGSVYDKLMNVCDRQIAVLINGQTETTFSSQSSGYAQSQTHEVTKEQVQEDTRRYVQRILNSKLLPLLQLHGYPVKGGKFLFVDDDPEMDADKKIFIWKTAMNEMNLPISDDDIYEQFGIPKPDNYDRLKKELEQRRQFNPFYDYQPRRRPDNEEEEKEDDDDDDTQLFQSSKLWKNFMKNLKSFFA